MAQIGVHVSVAGGLANGLVHAELLDIDTIQVFGSSPRQWRVRQPTERELSDYWAKQKERPVEPVFLHAPYMINLATENKEIRTKSIEALAGHLMIAEKIEAAGLVFHAGSSPGTKKDVLERIVWGIVEVLERTPGSAQLIVENSARSGTKAGVSPAELGFIVGAIDSRRVAACLDTAHAFQSGVLHCGPDRIGRYLEEWEDKLGLENLRLLHANDSATEFNSGRDLHANIGEGFIGLEGFRALAEQPALQQLPWILEVPGFGGKGPDPENVERLRECFG